MTEQWQSWRQRFASLSLRERVLILFTAWLLLGLPAYYLWLEPMQQQQAQMEQELLRLHSELTETQRLIDYSKGKLTEDPNAALKRQLLRLQAQLSQLDSQLARQQASLIPVGQMAEVLEKLLQQTQGLQLLSLDSIAPEAILSAEESGDSGSNFYRHGIRLQLSGSYFPLLAYLQTVEALPQQFLWQVIDYQVEAYPRANITIEIYTLSSNKDFISA